MTSTQRDLSASQANDPPRDLAFPPFAKSLNSSGDPLTGLASRTQFTDFLAGSLRMHGDSEDSFAVVLLDIDRFRDMNDRVGPAVCEKLLCLMAQRLRTIGRSASLVGRTSGDGFGLIVRDASVAVEFAEMLLSFLTRPFAVDGHAVTLGVSIGVARAGLHGREALELLHAANLAVHDAKRSGGSRVRMFDPSMRQHALNLHTLETDLRAATATQRIELQRALIGHQFELHYQPQVSLVTGFVTGFEALLRWRHPERGLVAPDQFLPVAEDIGLMDLLGDSVLRSACTEAASWPVSGSGRPLRVAVNVSPTQLRNRGTLIEALRRALAETGLPPERLEIELTESALVEDITSAMLAIRDMGVAISLDDFGVGYSSLGRLCQHPFNRIKIDRSFVSRLNEAAPSDVWNAGESMIRAVVSLGKALNMETICEGVETVDQLRIAQRAGCTEVQGFLIGRPCLAKDVASAVERLGPASLHEWIGHE